MRRLSRCNSSALSPSPIYRRSFLEAYRQEHAAALGVSASDVVIEGLSCTDANGITTTFRAPGQQQGRRRLLGPGGLVGQIFIQLLGGAQQQVQARRGYTRGTARARARARGSRLFPAQLRQSQILPSSRL